MSEDNIVSAVTLGGGVIYVSDEETEDFLATLIDKGILWEFLSSILTEYVKGGRHKDFYEQQNNLDEIAENLKQLKVMTETNKNLENEMVTMKDQMATMMKLMSSLSTSNVVTVAPNSVTAVSVAEPKTEPVVAKKKVAPKPPTGKTGGFAAMAKKASAFNRK